MAMEEPLDEMPLVLLSGIASELIPGAGIAESRAIGSTDPLLWRSYVREVLALVEGLTPGAGARTGRMIECKRRDDRRDRE
jgi:hypothetical protein